MCIRDRQPLAYFHNWFCCCSNYIIGTSPAVHQCVSLTCSCTVKYWLKFPSLSYSVVNNTSKKTNQIYILLRCRWQYIVFCLLYIEYDYIFARQSKLIIICLIRLKTTNVSLRVAEGNLLLQLSNTINIYRHKQNFDRVHFVRTTPLSLIHI